MIRNGEGKSGREGRREIVGGESQTTEVRRIYLERCDWRILNLAEKCAGVREEIIWGTGGALRSLKILYF